MRGPVTPVTSAGYMRYTGVHDMSRSSALQCGRFGAGSGARPCAYGLGLPLGTDAVRNGAPKRSPASEPIGSEVSTVPTAVLMLLELGEHVEPCATLRMIDAFGGKAVDAPTPCSDLRVLEVA
jgi:hypothetical protein